MHQSFILFFPAEENLFEKSAPVPEPTRHQQFPTIADIGKERIRRAIAINPESRSALVDLGELLMDNGNKDEARALLKRAIDAPIDPAWGPEDKETAAHASVLLKKLDKDK